MTKKTASYSVPARFHAHDRWSILAFMRFLLASIVAINHLEEFTDLGIFRVIPRFGSFEAILGFLLISGYSVTSSYVRQPNHFLKRRLWRLYPIYLTSIGITLAVDLYENATAQPTLSTLVVNALFLNQMITATSYVGPAWSLSLEFWLYCLLPFFFRLGPRGRSLLVWASFSSYLIYTCLRTLLHLPYYAGLGYGLNIPLLLFTWVLGMRLACEPENRANVLKSIGTIFVIHIGLSTAIQFGSNYKRHSLDLFFTDHIYTYILHLFTLFSVLMIFARITRKQTGTRKSRLMRTLGDISYPLYLLHVPVFAILKKHDVTNPILSFLLAVASSYIIYLAVDIYSQRRESRSDQSQRSSNFLRSHNS